jgi:HlyD family secretion protein
MAARRQAAAAVSRVETAAQFAEREAGRQRELTGQGASSARVVERAELEERSLREELSSARFGARVADYDYEMATAALGRLSGKRPAADQIEVTSPVAGRVLRVLQQSEGVVQPGSPLLELGDASALEVVVDVLTSDAVRIKPSARVVIERWGGEKPLRAHVRSVEPSAFTRISALGVEEQRVNVIIDLDDPPSTWAALGDGYRVEARIVTAEAPNALRVPASAVFRHGEQWALYVVRDDRAQLVSIEIGARNDEHFEVTRGLSAGQSVVLHPGDRVADGVRVQRR